MSDPFLAEIRIFPFSFAPANWAFCNGQTIPIRQNTQLFSIIGTMYGGDGTTTFGLPNMQGSVPMQADPTNGYDPGDTGGSQSVTLTAAEMPAHSHNVALANQTADVAAPTSAMSIARPNGASPFVPGTPAPTYVQMSTQALTPYNGGGAAHNNMMPYLTVNFCISLQGVFPPRG